MSLKVFFVFIGLSVVLGCSPKHTEQTNTRFELISSDHSGLRFVNAIEADDSVNIMNYEYLYNGAGVGVIDINNDGLKDLLFTGGQQNNALYLNKGNLQFEDITTTAGVAMEDKWSTGVSVVDINNDGFDDLYIGVGGMGNKSIFPNQLFINQQNNTFKEAAAEYGLADQGESIQSVFFDYDKDGDLDMYLLTGGGFERSAIVARPIFDKGQSRNTDRLYRNDFDQSKGHPVFTNVSEEAGILVEGFGLGVAIIDANEDGWPDVYVSNDYLSRDLLYINNQNGTFTDESLSYLKHTSHFSMGNDVGDINNDGYEDIITVDMLPEDNKRRKLMAGAQNYDRFYMAVNRDYGYQYMRNMLQLNHGDNGFSEIGQMAGIDRTDWSWAPLLADLDNDGYQDIYITNGFGKDITDMDFVKFRKDAVSNYNDKAASRKLMIDSLKERPAIVLPNYIYQNNKDLTFTNRVKDWGLDHNSISSGAAYADLDNDGDLELIASNIDREVLLFKNKTVEQDSTQAAYLKVKLEGPASNPSGLGATIALRTAGNAQVRTMQVARGFQSSVDKTIHFGLGGAAEIEQLTVTWPDGKQSTHTGLKPNQLITSSYAEAVASKELISPTKESLLKAETLLSFNHTETDFSDLKSQPLLLHGFSAQGPGLAVGDVNGDGHEDVFVGGAYGSSGAIFMQTANAQFQKQIVESEFFEDLGAVFFDADGDLDLDLYVTSGGSERYNGHNGYKDRLYTNNGKGEFTLAEGALPTILSSTSVVAAEDFDRDGDIDLFVGGRVKPADYPATPNSYLLVNEGGHFVDKTDLLSPDLRNVGMVTSAIWTDHNNDSYPDLMLVGEGMPIELFNNDSEKLVPVNVAAFSETHGMWNSLEGADFDNDGDIDYIAGNLGLNTPFTVSADEPLELFYKDFDNNGATDLIYSTYQDGQRYPLTSLDMLIKQVPKLRKSIFHYRNYAKATTSDLLEILGDEEVKSLKCELLSSVFIENQGNGQFAISPLPQAAQLGPVNGMVSMDFNQDGLLDIALVGSAYDTEVTYGRYDASIGTVLLNKGHNHFEPLSYKTSGFSVKGNAKALAKLNLSNGQLALLATQSNGPVKAFTLNQKSDLKHLKVKQEEVSAIIYMEDGSQRKMEFYRGGNYITQNARSIAIMPQIKRVQLLNVKGEVVRQVETDKNSLENLIE